MAFINEYISQDDMAKYKIRDLWRRIKGYVSESDAEVDAYVGRASWTVDKSQEIFFIFTGYGKEEESNQMHGVLGCKDMFLNVSVAAVGGHFDYKTKIGAKTWSLIHISKPEGFFVSDAEIVSALKSALTAYQFDGIKTSMIDYPVTFTF